jgi:hypothetical protein
MKHLFWLMLKFLKFFSIIFSFIIFFEKPVSVKIDKESCKISFLEKMLRSENEKFIYITPLKDHNKPNVIKTNAREIGKKTFQHRRIS